MVTSNPPKINLTFYISGASCLWYMSTFDNLLKKLIVMQDLLPNWKQSGCSGLKATYLLLFIVWIFPVWKTGTFKQTPSPMPCSKTRHILKHGEKSPFSHIQLKLWAQLELDITFQWRRICHLWQHTAHLYSALFFFWQFVSHTQQLHFNHLTV